MDEYELEIQNVRRTLAELRERHSRPELIEEYEAELRNLRALYRGEKGQWEAFWNRDYTHN